MESSKIRSLLQTRFFPLIFVVALLPLIAAVGWFYMMSFRSIELVLEQQTGHMVNHFANTANQVYSDLIDETNMLIRGRELGQFYTALKKTNRNEAIEQYGEDLKAYFEWWISELSNDIYQQVIYFDNQANPVYKYVFKPDFKSEEGEVLQLDSTPSSMLFTALDRFGIPDDGSIQLTSVRIGDETVFRLVRPLRPLRGQKEFLGYLAVDISMAAIVGDRQYSEINLLIHSNSHDKILFSSINQEVLDQELSLVELMPALGSALGEKGRADSVATFTYKENGANFLASRVNLVEPSWVIIAFTPMDSYLAPTKLTGNSTLAITVCFMIFSVWIVAKLSRRVQERSALLEQANADLQEVNGIVREQNLLLEEELQKAHTMQMQLMPTSHPRIAGFDIAGICRPATHVGGDFFQYFTLPDGRLVLAMADVTGHGMEAAIPTVLFSGILDNQIEYDSSPEILFPRLNRSLYRTLDRRTFVCFTMGELQLKTRRIRVTNGGCPYPYYYSATTGQVDELRLDAFPLGLRAESEYGVVEIELAPGDRIVLCSDGIIEAQQEEGEIFGFERTADVIGQAARENMPATVMIERLLGAVDLFTGIGEQLDDQTIVVLGVESES